MALKYLDKTAKIEMTDVYYVQLTLGDGTVYENVELRRLFPISDKFNYISLLDKDEHEIAMIKSLDDITPESAAAIHPNNVKRVIRALEIYHGSGVRKSELDRRSQACSCDYDATVIGLRYADRERLYERINRRVDAMLEAGLLDEVKSLRERGVFERSATAAQAIGYKEFLSYLRGESSMGEATEALKTATRRYAKRQMTWFSAKPYVAWFEADGIADPAVFDAIVKGAVERFSE